MIRKASKIWRKLGNLIGRYRDLLIFFILLHFTLLALLTSLGKMPSVTTVEETGSEIGIGSNEDNHLVEKVKPIRALEGLRVNAIVEAEGEVWIGTDSGAYRVEKGNVIRVPDVWRVNAIAEIGGEVWMGTDRGAFRVQKKISTRVPEIWHVNTIAEVWGEVWIGTDKGAHRMVRGMPVRVVKAPGVNIITVSMADSTIWIGTDDGAYQMKLGKPIHVLKGLRVATITEVGSEVWIGTEYGVYSVEREKPISVLEVSQVNTIVETDSEVWIGTDGGAYWMEKDSLTKPHWWRPDSIESYYRYGYQRERGTRIRTQEGQRVTIIAKVNNEIWIGTSNGAYRVEKGKPILVLEGPWVTTITEVNREIWIGTEEGAYRVEWEKAPLVEDKLQTRRPGEWLRYVPLFLLVIFVIVKGFQLTNAKEFPKRIAEKFQEGFMQGKRELIPKHLAYELEQLEQARAQMEGLFPQGETYERPGIHLAHRRIQATVISGDFYNFIPRGDGSLGIYFVDVEGHGLLAAIQAQFIYQALTDREWGLGDARRQLEKADELIRRGAIFQKEEAAFCMNFTEIDPEKMVIRHANAGMPFLLLFRWGQAQPETLQAAGIYVGAGYSRYPVKPESVEVKVGDGDLLVIASDGIPEARDKRGRIFGQKGITAAVYKNRYQSPEVIADEILRAVKRHTGKERPDDDQTLVVVQIGQPVKGSHLVTVKTLEMKNDVFSLLNAGDTGAACHYELREKLKAWAQNRGFEERRIRQIWAATWEAIQNAVKYGSRRGNAIYIRLIFIGYEGLVKVEVTQPLLWEDWDKVLGQRMKNEVQTDKVLMGGTIIMLWLANEIQVTDRGRRITMAFSKNVVPERKVKVFF